MDEKSELIGRIQYLITKDSKNKSQILRELSLSTSTLSDWEKGKGNPSCSAIIKLANYFEVSSDYLLFGIENAKCNELSNEENKWLQLLYAFPQPQRQSLLEWMQNPDDRKDLTVWLNYLNQLNKQERELCFAFAHGILAGKSIKEI